MLINIKGNDQNPMHSLEITRNNKAAENKTKKADQIYFIKQKISGLVLAIISLIMPFIEGGEVTGCVLILFLGLCLLFAKMKIMIWN